MNRRLKFFIYVLFIIFIILLTIVLFMSRDEKLDDNSSQTGKIVKINKTNNQDSDPFANINNVNDQEIVNNDNTDEFNIDEENVEEILTLDQILELSEETTDDNFQDVTVDDPQSPTQQGTPDNTETDEVTRDSQTDNTEVEQPGLSFSNISASRITYPEADEDYKTRLSSDKLTLKWNKETDDQLIDRHKVEIKYNQDNTTIFQDTINNLQQTELDIEDLPQNGKRIRVDLTTYFKNNTSDSITHRYTLHEKKSELKIKAFGDIKVGDSPRIKIYIDGEYTGYSEYIKESRKDDFSSLKTYTFEVPEITYDKTLSIAYDNDTKDGARDLFITKVELDGETVFEKKNESSGSQINDNYSVEYDRANRNDGNQYPNSDNWGNIESGFFDGKGISNWDAYSMLWNGSVNIKKK